LIVKSIFLDSRTWDNALISLLNFFNRNLGKKYGFVPDGELPGGGIYSYPPDTIHNRVSVVDWAFDMLYEIIKKRVR